MPNDVDQYVLTFDTLVAGILLVITILGSVLVSFWNSDAPRTWRGFANHAVPPEWYRHPSARADIWFVLSVRVVNALLAVPILLTAVGIGLLLNHGLRSIASYPPATEPLTLVGLIGFTVLMLIVNDFGNYIYHYALHKVPILWELHKVHHSAEVLIGFTRFRVHPIDVFLNKLWDGITGGIVYGVWLFFGYPSIDLAIYAATIYRLRNILMFETTRHTHYKISFGKFLDQIFISPHYHQLHHSSAPQHWDKNFGVSITLWDRLFGTFMAPTPNETFVFGLSGAEHANYRSCLKLYMVPIVNLLKMGRKRSVTSQNGTTATSLVAELETPVVEI